MDAVLMDADVSNSTNVTITYVAGYGTSPVKQTITTYDASGMVTVQQTFLSSNLPTLTYPYGTFAGWFTTETFDSDTKVNVGDAINDTFGIVATGDYSVTLYAKWESEQHLINAMDLQNIADAIREFTGTTAGLKPGEWASAIRYGGSAGTPSPK